MVASKWSAADAKKYPGRKYSHVPEKDSKDYFAFMVTVNTATKMPRGTIFQVPRTKSHATFSNEVGEAAKKPVIISQPDPSSDDEPAPQHSVFRTAAKKEEAKRTPQ